VHSSRRIRPGRTDPVCSPFNPTASDPGVSDRSGALRPGDT